MNASDDPFDPRPADELLATDALLDRLGARAPTPDDLDDPLIAALALMAAEVDRDAPPLEDTRAALERAVPELDGAPAPSASEGLPHDESSPPVIDLRDSAARRTAGRGDVRRPQRPRHPERTGPPVAMAPPRSLPRMPPPGGPGGSRAPRGRRERKMRPMVAVAVAIAAIVLGSGVSAAVTGGRSVNPLDGIQQVVAGLTHGRTQDQLAAYTQARKHLTAAQAAARENDLSKADAELDRITPALLRRLTDDDRAGITKGINQLRAQVGD
jgi:hypothetical protein